ncbi:MAG TPA: VanZ family protein [Phaeodactylibacter sp.]|nr:VanZ family protein [Phaeodactylibacter sp.]
MQRLTPKWWDNFFAAGIHHYYSTAHLSFCVSQNKIPLKSYIPAIVWGFIILLLSTRATINLPPTWTDLISVDKVGHAFFYAVFTALILKGHQKPLLKKNIIQSLLISISYGVLMEIIQYSFFPNRFFEVYDIIANISGSFLGLYLFKKQNIFSYDRFSN